MTTEVQLRSVGEQLRNLDLDPTPTGIIRINEALLPYVLSSRVVMQQLNDKVLGLTYEKLSGEERKQLDWEGAVTLWRLEQISGQPLKLPQNNS